MLNLVDGAVIFTYLDDFVANSQGLILRDSSLELSWV